MTNVSSRNVMEWSHVPPLDRRPADRRSRIQRWRDAVSTLTNLLTEYARWLEALPDNQQDGTTAEALQAIVELDLSELQAIEPPRGFGRD
jgi:hypothetical protein